MGFNPSPFAGTPSGTAGGYLSGTYPNPTVARVASVTASGPPTSGTYSTGDMVCDQAGLIWVCSAGGTPGTWAVGITQSIHDQYLRPTGVLYETVSRASMLNTGITPTGGTMQMMSVSLPNALTIGHLQFASSTGAGTPSNWWAALFDNNLNLLAETANQLTASFGTGSYKSLAIATIASGASATFTTTYSGVHYVGFVMTVSAGAVVTLIGGGHAAASLAGQAVTMSGTGDAGLTTPYAFPHTATAISPTSNVFWAGVGT